MESFARYLAFEEVVDNFEEVVDNFDDIDGPGNNSYLRYDAESGGFTVVAWDHNLAFGVMGGMGGRSNVLVERFTAVEEWADLVEQAQTDLTTELFDSGYAEDVLDEWTTVLTEQAGDWVDADTVEKEADAIREKLS